MEQFRLKFNFNLIIYIYIRKIYNLIVTLFQISIVRAQEFHGKQNSNAGQFRRILRSLQFQRVWRGIRAQFR